MKVNILKILLYITIIVLIYACAKETKHSPLLLKADSIMPFSPDSSYNLLCSIKNTELHDNEENALYSLLLTQAKDKKHIPHINDSLISVAINYYKNTNNYYLKSKSYFYLGRVLQENSNISQAINAYLKALNQHPNNYIMQVQIYDNLAECYENQNFFQKALEMYQNSYAINKEHNDSTRIIYPLRGIANIYLLKEDTSKAINCYKQALHILKITKDSIWKSTILCDMARLFHNQKKYKKAYKYINGAQKNTPISDDLSAIFFWKGMILSDLGKYDSAFHYLSKATLSKDIYTQAASYQSLYELKKKQYLYDEAIAYNDEALTLYDSIQNSQHQEEINDILKEHALTAYRQEQKQIHIKQITILCFCTLLGVATLIITFMHISNCEKKKYIKLQAELIKIISDRNKLKKELKELSLMNEDTNKINEELQTNLWELWKQTMQICTRLFQTTDSFKRIVSIEKSKYMPDKQKKMGDIKAIRVEIKNVFAEAIQNIQELCPSLTQEDILYCILSYLKLSSFTIKMYMEVASSAALTQRKYRIKKQLAKPIFDFIF